LTAIHDGLTSQSLIHQSALRDLEDCARDCFDPEKDLESLDPEQRELLLNRLNDTVGVPT